MATVFLVEMVRQMMKSNQIHVTVDGFIAGFLARDCLLPQKH